MIPLLLVILPAVLGLFTLSVLQEERRPLRRFLLVMGAVLHFAGTLSLYLPGVTGVFNAFIVVDPLGKFFLTITSFLFLLVSFYSVGYFSNLPPVTDREGVSHLFVPCMLFFLSAMTLACVIQHLGLLWVAIEATTLSSAPLIYYHHQPRALEAAWKYLLICSVGLGLALLGIFFVAAASKQTGTDLFLADLIRQAGVLEGRWLRIGFILVLVGFGTKMGLAPLHNWLPDAHSEAPSPVSALLSGALLNCAFLGILRLLQICTAAGLEDFARELLTLFGLVSLFVSAVFIVGQKDYKRMLAYSSVEHMGIASLGVGVGSRIGSLLHVLNHSLTKCLLFLVAGQIVLFYRTKKISEVQGLLKTLPPAGWMLTLGGLAVIGSPPFAPFISEFWILRDGFAGGHFWAMGFYLLMLGIIFAAMSRVFIGMIYGERREIAGEMKRPLWLVLPPLVLTLLILALGLYLPPQLVGFLKTCLGVGG